MTRKLNSRGMSVPMRWTRPRTALAAALATMLTAASGLLVGGADPAVAMPASSPSTAQAPWHGERDCATNPIRVRATSIPAVDRRRIQDGIDDGQASGRCVVLIGQFNVGRCVQCLKITGPVRVTGQGDPTGPSPRRRDVTVVRAGGGLGLLAIDLPANHPDGVVKVSNIWWRGSTLIAITMQNVHRGTVELRKNRITDVRERLRFRFGILGSVVGTPNAQVLAGNLVIRDNYIDATTRPFLPGDDNGVAGVGWTFDSVDISNNTVTTNGESIEIEGSAGRSYRISGNTLSSRSRRDSIFANLVTTVGFPRLHGGHPAALKLAGNDVADVAITNNDVTSSGGSQTMVCIMHSLVDGSASVHPSRTSDISGNRCTMDHIFAAVLAGWSGEMPFFPAGQLDDATIHDNTFVGSAQFGITWMDFTTRAFPDSNLVNRGHGNVVRDNSFARFTPGVATVYFGPSTHDNSFSGDPNGPVLDLGTDNHVETPGA